MQFWLFKHQFNKSLREAITLWLPTLLYGVFEPLSTRKYGGFLPGKIVSIRIILLSYSLISISNSGILSIFVLIVSLINSESFK
nr:hypothetical protein [Ureaplasma parvum]